MTCAICGTGTLTGRYRDAQDRPVHYYCLAQLALVRATAAKITTTGTPVRVRRQYARRVHR